MSSVQVAFFEVLEKGSMLRLPGCCKDTGTQPYEKTGLGVSPEPTEFLCLGHRVPPAGEDIAPTQGHQVGAIPTTSDSLNSPFFVPLMFKLLRENLTHSVSHHPGLASLEGLEA